MTKRFLVLAASVVIVVAVNGLLPFNAAQASIGGSLTFVSDSSVTVYENTNTAAGATFDFGVSVSSTGGCTYPVTFAFSWTDAAKNAQSFTLAPCGSHGVRTTLPAMLKGAPTPAITMTVSGAGNTTETVAWTVEEVK